MLLDRRNLGRHLGQPWYGQAFVQQSTGGTQVGDPLAPLDPVKSRGLWIGIAFAAARLAAMGAFARKPWPDLSPVLSAPFLRDEVILQKLNTNAVTASQEVFE